MCCMYTVYSGMQEWAEVFVGCSKAVHQDVNVSLETVKVPVVVVPHVAWVAEPLDGQEVNVTQQHDRA